MLVLIMADNGTERTWQLGVSTGLPKSMLRDLSGLNGYSRLSIFRVSKMFGLQVPTYLTKVNLKNLRFIH